VSEVREANQTEYRLIAQRTEALEMVRDLLKNYRDNDRNGLGIAPIMRAQQLLKKYKMSLDD